ncbi:hypothetical protein BOTBODRAFT_151452 [Botryobasidium botryosum FD-172 SS1]|uniref:Mitochondrial carrier n=1 Tax=Botryobasidium botryosum (strain FD-172 SS1) TaxID=930990 RepID=A0A067MY13_BOTB1|nr:hypothetical protein BOTBODRAFT_151452 [Botryobasidium botryosum FD-172 SS1]
MDSESPAFAAPRPASLRNLYSPPSDNWEFVPSSSPTSSAATPDHSWSTRPSKPSVFDLSPAYPSEDDLDFRSVIKPLIGAALLQFAGTAIANPFEVGKTLLQIQWVPKSGSLVSETLDTEETEEDEGELSDSSEASYFQDPSETTTFAPTPHRPRRVDEQGYVIRQSVLDRSTRPDYIIPVGPQEGVWGMIKRVGRWKTEGWLSLWKGQLTTCVIDTATASIQPLINLALIMIFQPFDPTASLPLAYTARPAPALTISITSHLITGFILSPLDLIRTRLIAQASSSADRSYTGPLDALNTIIAEEGGLYSMYFHPNLFFPTILDNSIRPLLSLSAPFVISRVLGISEESHPVAHGFAEFAYSSASLLITLPIETARRRLQVQNRGRRSFKACVETRPMPYVGVMDVIWCVLTEERSGVPKRRRRKSRSKGKEKDEDGSEQSEALDKESWFADSGVAQLYRGFGTGIWANVIVFALGLFSGPDDKPDGGWAEL